jgi:hypothetical protein
MLLAWGGTYATEPTETWSNSLRLISPAVDDPFASFDYDGSLVDAKADITALMADAGSGYSTLTRMTWVKLNEIGPDGRYVDQTDTHALYFPGSTVSGFSTNWAPLNVAGVVTMLTDRERGPASRGRVFVPSPTWTMGTGTFRYSNASLTSAVAAWSTFIQAIGNWPGADGPEDLRPAVVSDRGVAGTFAYINAVQIGNVPDTQRRRREQLVEVRTTSSTFDTAGIL